MQWLNEYLDKRTTAADAVSEIRSGQTVYIHPGCAVPLDLVNALVERSRDLEDVQIVHLKTMGGADYTRPEYERSFRTIALFIGDNVRQAVQEGRAEYVPIFLHEIEGLFERGEMRLDYALIQVSPPDKYGYFSLGVGIETTLTAARHARRVIAEVNPNMPRTHGQTFLHISEIHRIVEVNHPLPEMAPEPANDIQRRIARNVASLIPDGATLQMGIGAVPDAVLGFLTNHRDLGMHTEIGRASCRERV